MQSKAATAAPFTQNALSSRLLGCRKLCGSTGHLQIKSWAESLVTSAASLDSAPDSATAA